MARPEPALDRVEFDQQLRSAALAQEAHIVSEGSVAASPVVLVPYGLTPHDSISLDVRPAGGLHYCIQARATSGRTEHFIASVSTLAEAPAHRAGREALPPVAEW